MQPFSPQRGDAYSVTNNGCVVAKLTLCQQINLRALKIVFFTFPLLRVRILKDNNNSPHGKFHRFSRKFSDLNFASSVLYICPCYVTRDTHMSLSMGTYERRFRRAFSSNRRFQGRSQGRVPGVQHRRHLDRVV